MNIGSGYINNLLHKGKDVLFLDIETTGFPTKYKPIDIIEVGMKFIPEMGYKRSMWYLSQLYSIGDNIVPYKITQITGITKGMLEGKPHISSHINALQKCVNKSDIVVAHNAPFDIRCLELTGVSFANKEVFDTATHSKRMFPEIKKHTMDSMCNYLGISNVDAHRAIHDVDAMIEIYLEITNQSKYPDKIKSLIKKHKKLTYTKKDSK